MPRANRHFLKGYVWHITQRCHRKEFLLKFARDRKRWIRLLYEAKLKYGLCVLNYIVTSNHIHLLVFDQGKNEVSKSMQMIAGRTAQEYNKRKRRLGAYWQDRYHATAVDTHEYLARCVNYIDMNMVRAGVVSHPSRWNECGYNEIQNPPSRRWIVDSDRLAELLSFGSAEQLRTAQRIWVDDAIKERAGRCKDWSTGLAVVCNAGARRAGHRRRSSNHRSI